MDSELSLSESSTQSSESAEDAWEGEEEDDEEAAEDAEDGEEVHVMTWAPCRAPWLGHGVDDQNGSRWG